MALYLSRRLLRAMKDTVFSDALESLFDKIRTTLPPPTVSYIDRMAETFRVRSRGYRRAGAGSVAVNQIHEAILQRHSLDIVYYTMSRNQEDKRRVDPYKLLFFDGAFYLIGYCHMRKGIRIFALDRIRQVNATGSDFEPVEAFDPDRLMESSFGVFLGVPVKVRIRFSKEIAGYITERIWHEDQIITARRDGGVDFEATVAGTDEIKFWVLGWGRHAEVLSPEKLKREIAEEIAEVHRRYRSEKQRNA
jgi:predicted DNA-binding transcriptional regulator YafY